MRKNIISLILSILCCYPLASGNQPNVVLIISDDAGYADFGFMNEVTGNTTDILTPELDTLRSQGSLCSVAYTGAVCSPSRGSILTGSYQQRVGYFYNINNALDPADGPDGFANNEVIAFERMKSAGYKTLAIGKWHVGAQADTLNATGNKVVIPGNRPPRQGVDHFFGMLSGSRDYDVPMDDHAFGSYEYRQRGLREMSPGNKDDSLANDVDEEQNSKWAGDVTDAFGLRAREYVTEHANQDYPFFLYVAFNAPHTPMYESSDYDLLNNPNHPNYANFNSMSTVRKKYCSMVYTMDKNIGLLMDRLKDPNNDGNTSDSVYDNTLIIFINDNGGSKKNESVNLPLRGDKGDPHDGGCRVPMLMTGPGISSDSIYDKPIHSMDLIPTMLAHGGNSIPTELMGSNLLDRVKETDSSDPHDYICVAGNNGLGLRKGDWKLVIGTNGVQTLFNTSSDVGEANDLAGDEPAKLDELIKDATNFDVQMDKPRFPSKGSSHETLNYNYSFTFAPNEVTTPSGVDKILIDYDDGDANNGEHDSAVNNGGFESNTATSGNQGKFNQINQWTNLASNGQNINAIRDNNTSPNGGGWNAVLSDANPASKDFGIDTGHSLTAGENFTVDYAWLDASSWVDSDKIRFQLFTTNDNAITGTQNIIHTEDSSSSTNLAYKTENFTFTAPSGVDGKTLFLRFYALDGNASTGFARVDNIFVGRLGSDQTQTEPQFWAGSDQWQDPSSASDTLLVTDSCALSTLVFPAESNFDYIAQNNLTRYTGLEFIQNTLSFTGNGSNSGKTAKISGNDIILAENYTNDTPPSINFNGDGDGYTFDLALDILLYHDTVIEGDGTATYLISGELKDYDNAVSLTKNGSSTLTLAHDATYSGNTIINGGMLEINPGITLAGSPQVQVSAGASLSGNGSVSGNVVGTGTLAPGQSIGTLAIAGDAQAGTLLIEIAANDADRMNVAGALDVSSMNLEITSLATPAQDTYIIASYGTLNGTFASITGVPNDYQILYTYDDSGSTNHIALAKINNVPNIDAIADQGNTTLDSVNLQASASDDDTADTLTFSATGLPAGLLINPSTGLISGTISSGAETGSAYSVVVTVTDNGSPAQSAEASFTWDVVAFNNAPTITPITTQANITKDVVSLPVNASDDVGDTLTYSASGLPSGLSINNASGLIFGTISDSAAAASPYSITVIVTDNGSPTKNAQTSFAWNVTAFNNAPTITAISDQTGITKDVISLSVSASDSDGDTLSYIATGLPSGLSIDSSTGLISGTISDDAGDNSSYSVTITVTDDGAKSAQASFTWNVSTFNNAPTITAISDQTGITKDVISLQVSANDSDGDDLSYTATGLPTGLSISSSTGLISGTISDDAGDNSSYSVTITVTDDGAKSAQASFTWNVSTFNNAPTITAISDQTNITKDVVSIQVSALDSDDDTLSYIATGLPSGLSIDSSTGLISGTISDDAGDNSSYSVTITVTDDGAKSAQASFTWNVSTFNNAPTITAISDQTNITKDVVSIQVSALDSDDDTLSYIATGLPSGLSIDSSTGLISGTISDDAGDNSSYSVTITVTDDGAKSAQASFTWIVSAFNNAPTITAISNQTNITKDVVSIQVSALDSDDDTLSYSATGLPTGLSIGDDSGIIAGTIADDAADSSPYSVTITVSDDGSPAKNAETSFTWNVSAFNNAPTISAISDQTGITKDVISLQVSANDSDGDDLSYTATGLPSGLSIDSSTGLISGTISDDAGDNSSYSVTITVTDDGAKSAQASFTWNVSTFNNAPTITAISDQTGITKDVISLQVSANDSDGDDLSYTATGLPTGLSISSSTGLISGTISDDAGDNSSYSVTITVTDDGAKSAQALFTWNVSTFNNAPTISAISDQTGITKDVVSIQVSALDSDDDTLSYIATGLPSGLSIDSSTGLISGTISDDAGDNSSYSVTITVTDDGAKSAQASFTWNVSTFNNAPTITAISDQTGITKDVISLQVSANDSDGDDLSYTATGLPSGLSIDSSTGLISGTISDDAGDNSSYSVTITVTDDRAKSAQASFTWNVSTFNNAPTITAISDQTNITKDVVSIQVSALDSDDDTLSYSATGLPTGLSIGDDSGIIAGTIADDAADSSPYSVTITVSDDGSPAKNAETSFTWNVSAFNNAPTISAISDQTGITKDVVSIQVSALDSDDDTLSYSATGLPSGLSIDSSTGLISGTISDDAGDNSSYSVTITVTDDGAKSAQASFTWNISTFNNAPTITAISDQTNITKDVVSIQVSAADSDGDDLSYTATGLPTGLSISSSTGLISGTLSDAANYNVTVTVTDNRALAKNAQTSFAWNVTAFNNAPTITAISDQTNITKDVVSVQVSALDSDDDTLSYSATGLPSGLSISNDSGIISGTIADDAADSSPYSVTITVSDDGSPAKNAETSFTWNVSAFNNAPTIDAVSNQTSLTKDVISLATSASDSDGDTLSYSANGLPSELSINSSSGIISGTISDDSAGSSPYNVTITVTDDRDPAKSAQTSFTWIVSAFNNAPTITAISGQTNITKDVVSLQVSADDSDDDTLSYSATGLPTGLAINSSTGSISGTLANDADAASPYSVTIIVADDGSPTKSTQTSFAWSVSAFNHAPTIDAVSGQTNITKDVISLSVSASDSDGDTLSYIATGLPSGLSIDSSTGLISGTISDDAGDNSPYSVTVTVTDDRAKSAQALFTWNVSTFNNAPTITAISDQTNITKDVVSIQVSALDSDDDTLSYIATGLPTGLAINLSTGLISGTLANDAADSSPYSVSITVTDNGSPSKNAETSFTWIVSAFNNAPTITAISGQTNITKDVIAGLSVIASDADGDSLSYNASGLPSGLSIGNDSGIISGTIADDAADSSPYNVTITVTDEGSPAKNAQTSFTWNVSAFNNAPTITAISDQTDTTKDVISLQVSAADSDGDTLSYIATGLPSGLSIDLNTGLISGTISDDAGDNSSYSVTVTVTDDRAKSAQALFTWNVSTFNNAPTISAISDQTGITKDVISLSVSASDSDGDTLSYSATGLPSGLSIDLNTGLISGTISGTIADDAADSSPYSVTVTVTDDGSPAKNAETSLAWVVNSPPDASPPTADLTSPANDDTITTSVINAQGYLEVNFSDVGEGIDLSSINGDELTLSGTGVGTAILVVDEPTLVSGTTYRYGFSGDFVEGTVSVDFVAGSFADLAGTPNVNLLETESFTVAVPPPFSPLYLDFGKTNSPVESEHTRVTAADAWDGTSGWQAGAVKLNDYDTKLGSDLHRDFNYLESGTFSVAVPDGSYDVTVTLGDTRPTSQVHDQMGVFLEGVQVDTVTTVPGEVATNTYTVAVSDGVLDLLLDDLGGSNPWVMLIALEVVASGPPPEDTTPPTADLSSPADGDSIAPTVLNAQAYLEVTFADSGDGLDAATIDGNELSLSGSGVGTATLSGGAPTLVSGTTYRYGFSGDFVEGTVSVDFVAGSFADLAGTPNVNLLETESFTVAVPPPFSPLYLDFGKTNSPVESEHTRVTAADAWDGTSGWQAGAVKLNDYDTKLGSDLHRDFNYLESGTFSVAVPDGSYDVTVTLGDTRPTSQVHDQMGVFLEGVQVDTVTTVPGEVATNTYTVAVSDGVLDLLLDDLGGSNPWVMLIALEVVASGPPPEDTTPPTADLSSPADGDSIAPTVLNAQAYLEVTFADSGDGLDAATIDGNELSLSGSGVGTATLSGGAPTLVSGTTYRYGFSGDFVEGTVSVDFVAGSFADLAGTPNVNLLETESFTVAVPPPFSPLYLDFGKTNSPVESEHTRVTAADAWDGTSGWQAGAVKLNDYDTKLGSDLHRDFNYLESGTFSVAVPDGSYDVTVTLGDTRPTSQVHDQMGVFLEGVQVDTVTTVPGEVATNTYTVAVSDGVLDLLLDDLGGSNPWVMLIALEVVASGPPPEDTTPPTADLSSPADGDSIAPTVLNAQAYLEVTFADSGDGLDAATIDGNELSLSGSGVGTATLSGGAPTLVSGTTYRYGFSGDFVEGTVSVDFVAGSFADLAGTPNVNLLETESFTVAVPPPFSPLYLDFGKTNSPVESEHTRVTAADAWDGTSGWQAGAVKLNDYDTKLGSDLHRDFNYLESGTFSVAVPDGSYDVTVTLGDTRPTSQVHDQMGVFLEGVQVDTVTTVPGEVATNTYTVAVSDGVLDLLLDDLGGSNPWVMLIALEVVASGPPPEDTTPPTADLSSPADGDSIAPTVLNAQAYLEVTFADSGDGLDAATIDGNELSLSGSGVGTATLSGGAPTLVSGTTYRYGFSGDFVEGTVSVDFVAGSFADLAGTPNVNLLETESFTVAVPPPFSPLYLDFGKTNSPVESEHTRVTAADAWDGTSGWQAGAVKLNDYDTKLGSDLHRDFNYLESGTFSVAVPDGSYDVTVTLGDTRPTSQVHDQMGVFLEGVQVDTVTTVPGEVATNTYTVAVSDGVLDLLLDDLGGSNPWVMLIALEVVASGPPPEDTTPPTADLSSPADGDSIAPTVLNAQAYLEVTFADSGDGLDAATIDGNELSLSGSGVGTATLSGGAPTLVSGTTYRYGFSGDFVEGTVSVDFVAGSFADLAGTPNVNLLETESFTVAVPPPFSPLYLDFGKTNSPVESEHTRVTAADAWDGTSGWQAGAVKLNDYDTKLGSDLHRDFNYLESGTFSVAVPDGSYDVTVTLGDTRPTSQVHDQMGVFLEGVQVDTVTTVPGEVATNTYTVAVSDGVLDLLLDDLGGSNPWVMLIALEVVAAGADINTTESLSKLSINEGSPINIYNRYQLASGVLARTSVDITTTADSESDSANPTNLFPDNPNLTKISDYINYIADYIADDNIIFDEDWKEQDHNTQFTADLEALLELVFAAEAAEAADQAAFFYLQAFEMVDEKLIPRTDGFQEGGSPETDWIIIKEAQDIVYPDLLLLSEYLWLSAR